MKKQNVFLHILFIIIIVALIIVLILSIREYQFAKISKDNLLKFNSMQKECKMVGITSNYIYLIRKDEDNSIIEGSKWEVTNAEGKRVGSFATNENGAGGIVGLDYGEYYLKEVEVPQGEKLIEECYKIIFSSIDTAYTFVASPEGITSK